VYLILLGAPGTGKGTQAKILAERKNWLHISTGDMLREEVAKETEYGVDAEGYMKRGQLVPDVLIIAMLGERIRQPDAGQGFVLDGFPRNLAQARALDQALTRQNKTIDLALNISVPDDVLVKRLAGRWICRTCGQIYNEASLPADRHCNKCGGELYQRMDDTSMETVQNRLDVQKPPVELLEHYRSRGRLMEIDGNRAVEEVTRALLTAVKSGVPA